MDFAERITELCNKKGISVRQMERDNNIGNGTVSKWKNSAMPNGKVLLKLSEYFGVSTDYILTGEESGMSHNNYYLDQEIANIAQEIANKPGMKTMFEASLHLSEDDLQYVSDLIKRFVQKE